MTPPELVAAMTARGVTFTVVGDRLRVDAPAGELTETDWTTLAAHKPALLALLTPAQEPDGALAELDPALTVADVLRVFPDARVVAPEEAEPAPALAPGCPYGSTPPSGPCPVCGDRAWHQAGSGWTCSTCHPAPGAPSGAPTAAAAPGRVQGPVPQPVVPSRAPTREQVVDQLCVTLKALRWRALLGVGSYPVGGSRDAWEDFIRTADRPRLERALDAATRAIATLNGYPGREPGEEG